MQAQKVIDHLSQQGTWVNFDKTRDIVLFGDPTQEVTKIGVCWIATMQVIETAIQRGINFIVAHENCFYEESTSPHQLLLKARHEKMALLNKHKICIYRCHDVWDRMPVYGVLDAWGEAMGFNFEPRPVTSFYSYAHFEPTSVASVAKSISNSIKRFGQDSVTVLGDPLTLVNSICIGTGAITDVFFMLKQEAQCLVCTDDGITNWIHAQYCVDKKIPIILVHHPVSEVPGMNKMVEYLKLNFKDADVSYLDEGFQFHTY